MRQVVSLNNHTATPKFFNWESIFYWFFMASIWVIFGFTAAGVVIQQTGCITSLTREAFVPVFEGGYPVEDEFGQQSVMVKRTVWKVCDERNKENE